MLGTSAHTKRVEPTFPLLFHECFHFRKVCLDLNQFFKFYVGLVLSSLNFWTFNFSNLMLCIVGSRHSQGSHRCPTYRRSWPNVRCTFSWCSGRCTVVVVCSSLRSAAPSQSCSTPNPLPGAMWRASTSTCSWRLHLAFRSVYEMKWKTSLLLYNTIGNFGLNP